MHEIVLPIIVLMFGIYTIGLSLMIRTRSKFYLKVVPFFGGLIMIFYVLMNLKIITLNI